MPKKIEPSAKLPLAPKQQRSREKYERIIAAAYSLASEAGFEGVTLTKIAKRAGVAPSTVYTRFTDKEALLHALHEMTTEKSRAEIIARFDGLAEQNRPLKRILQDIIYRSIELTDEIAGFQKACYQRALSDHIFAEREARVR
jgi:AcrR family transcriptional regulator